MNPSDIAAYRALLQSRIRNLTVVSLVISSHPHDLGFCFTLVKAGREKQ